MAYDQTYGQTARRHARKTMAKPRNEELDQACLKWFRQLRGTATENVDQFRDKLRSLIDCEWLSLNQVYNADETGLYFRSLPTNTLADEKEKCVPGRKLSKTRVSALCGANATGRHRLQPEVVGTAKNPCCLRGVMDRLPVIYYPSRVLTRIFSNWFFNHAFKEIVRFQTETLGIPCDQVKALMLLDNASAHPCERELVGENGRIGCLFLPPNTTSILQPMDQGIIAATKCLYRRKFLGEVMVVLEDDDEVTAEEDTRGARTLENMKKYTLKSAIFNWATAWKDVKTSTLENGWKRLLSGEEPVDDFEGFEATDFMNQLRNAGERVTEETIDNWLESDEGDPGYQILTDEEIAASVTATEEQLANEDDEEDEDLIPDIPKLKQVCEAIDMLIDYMEHPNTNNEHFRPALPTYLRESREKIIKAQQRA
ncbi:hypothetical protein Pcinc_010860 [Petrolisthes cinctipes]|uniref:DDE-1 domain-containing protein n=1 Tax=Petrolisthes cinctipes TaxID=88211 RepID=A0AAE1KT74_PETCI|nr:hypothetical protein Pcinc_010860 [Petrolisthes cinctipes]